VVDEEIRIAEDYLKDSHEHLEYTIKSNRLRVGPEKMMKWIMDTVEEFKYGETYYEKRISFRYCDDEYYALESASRRKGDVMKVAKHE